MARNFGINDCYHKRPAPSLRATLHTGPDFTLISANFPQFRLVGF